MLNPVRKEACFSFDEGYKKKIAISYPCILKDNSGYKMYYVVWNNLGEFSTARAYMAVAESCDGISWERPDLNLYDHPELKHNNVVMDNIYDGLCVFFDQSPHCPENERYKAVGVYYTQTRNGEKHRVMRKQL